MDKNDQASGDGLQSALVSLDIEFVDAENFSERINAISSVLENFKINLDQKNYSILLEKIIKYEIELRGIESFTDIYRDLTPYTSKLLILNNLEKSALSSGSLEIYREVIIEKLQYLSERKNIKEMEATLGVLSLKDNTFKAYYLLLLLHKGEYEKFNNEFLDFIKTLSNEQIKKACRFFAASANYDEIRRVDNKILYIEVISKRSNRDPNLLSPKEKKELRSSILRLLINYLILDYESDATVKRIMSILEDLQEYKVRNNIIDVLDKSFYQLDYAKTEIKEEKPIIEEEIYKFELPILEEHTEEAELLTRLKTQLESKGSDWVKDNIDIVLTSLLESDLGELAVWFVEEYVEDLQGNKNYLYLAAEALLDQKKYFKLIALLEPIVEEIENPKDKINIIYLLAEAYFYENQFPRAYALYGQIAYSFKDYRLTKQRMKKIEKSK